MITLIGLFLPALLRRNLIVETLVQLPGSRAALLHQPADKQITRCMLAYTLAGAVLVVVGNLVADIALTIADPRIRLA